MKQRPFKNSEIGPVPEEWEISTIGHLIADGHAKLQTGPFGTVLKASEFVETGHPVVSVREIRNGYIQLYDETPCVSDETYEKLGKYALQADDLVFARKGSVERSALIPADGISYFLGSDGICLRLDSHCLFPRYMLYFLQLDAIRQHISRQAYGTTMVGLNENVLRHIPLIIPSLPDQRRIAAMLSDADAWSKSLEKLIEKKKLVKHGAMQALLSGKTRLPGFSGEWEERRLGECGVFRKGSGISREEGRSGNIPAVRYGELYTHHDCIIRIFASHISEAVARRATLLKPGDILFACSGETKEEIGKCAAFIHPVRAYAGGDLLIMTPNPSRCDSTFLGYALNASKCQIQKAAAGQGDAVVHIHKDALEAIEITFPPSLAEQRAIASVLSDMDAELAALSREKAKAEQIKQGMMQELLTGRVRVGEGE